MTVRKELRDLSPSEWDAYVSAVKALRTVPASRTRFAGLSKYEELAGVHEEAWNVAHSDPRFLVWHRAFLWEFEAALQQVDSKVSVPYWAWALPTDAQEPEKSTALSASYFGSSKPGACIPDGPFAGWTTHVRASTPGASDTAGVSGPETCVRRGLDSAALGTARLATMDELGVMMRGAKSFSEFSFLVEFQSHPMVHVLVGTERATGHAWDMATMVSPNDPLFFCTFSY
ncbi:hypothetical protein BC828DRAFT_351920 [Blastocladiella britannica]|nr:hypothetical protein BC828DRAFT_351920 [Blastocladiella britannica]